MSYIEIFQGFMSWFVYETLESHDFQEKVPNFRS